MNIFIETISNDSHSCAIKWLLKMRGHAVTIFSMAQYPAKRTLNLQISNTELRIMELSDTFDVCITRRRAPPLIAEEIHPADIEYATREAKVITESYTEFIKGKPFFINHPASDRSNNKILQLKLATQTGLNIPATLISNDSHEIENFLRQYNSSIYKSFYPALWQGANDDYLLFTSSIDINRFIQFKASFKYCPGIFQQRVDKSHEVRAVFMGRTCRAAKILSRDGTASLDWRKNSMDGSGFTISPILLPEDIYQRCITLMKQLNLVFGCFDFCVDHSGHYYFLEINPMGQFLWMENKRDICLLSLFCDFIESQDPDFLTDHTTDDFYYIDAAKTSTFMAIMDEIKPDGTEKSSYTFTEKT